MKHNDENICKFVTNQLQGYLDISNFVFEKHAKSYGKPQTWQMHIVHLVVSGTGKLSTKETTALLSKGMLFVTFAGQEFTIESTDSLTYMYISFSGTRADELLARIGITPDFCVFPDYEGLVTFWQNAISRASAKNLDLITESVLLYTFSQLAAFDSFSEKALINRLLHHIETKFTDPSLTLSSCAEYVDYNPKYISRCFGEHVGMSFSDYIKNMRIRHAIFLIENGVSLVKNVALLSGFSDPLYFSNCFRKIVGISPSEFISRQAEAKAKEEKPEITPAENTQSCCPISK